MRILVCGSTYPPRLDGQSIFTYNLTEGMVARQHEVVMLAPGERGRSKAANVNGVQVIPVSAVTLDLIHEDLRLPLGYMHAVRALFGQFQPDIVHAQDSSPLCQDVMREARRRSIPTVATHHIGPEIGAPYLTTENQILKKAVEWLAWRFILGHLSRADMVLVPSRFSVSMLGRKGLIEGVQQVPCAVRLDEFFIETGIDRQAIRFRYGLDPSKVLILYVGRLDVEKRVDVLISAIALLGRSDVQLVMAGQGSREKALHCLAEKVGIGENVRFLGQVHHGELPALINSADIFAMPGDVESFSIATLEAMACGRPILAANAGALPELVTHGEGGYLFCPGDADDLASGIGYLIERRDRWSGMAAINSRKARTYDLAHLIVAHEQAYLTAIQHALKNRELVSHSQPIDSEAVQTLKMPPKIIA